MSNKVNRSFLYKNGLSIVFLTLFAVTLCAQALTGWKQHNQELEEEQQQEISLSTYLQSGHFISATFENFESEFLQMALYVLLTVSLRQVGSAESKNWTRKKKWTANPCLLPKLPGQCVKAA
jgi:hypothetical protein